MFLHLLTNYGIILQGECSFWFHLLKVVEWLLLIFKYFVSTTVDCGLCWRPDFIYILVEFFILAMKEVFSLKSYVLVIFLLFGDPEELWYSCLCNLYLWVGGRDECSNFSVIVYSILIVQFFLLIISPDELSRLIVFQLLNHNPETSHRSLSCGFPSSWWGTLLASVGNREIWLLYFILKRCHGSFIFTNQNILKFLVYGNCQTSRTSH